MPKLLIIGHTFPETASTAAGVRMNQLINFFLDEGYQITFATAAISTPYSERLEERGIGVRPIILNSSSFDLFINELDPDTVLFDRFMTEEQFGWRVADQCPGALRILDSEDLHFLRSAREQAVKSGLDASDADLMTDLTIREIASIYRSDLTLIISQAEQNLLTDQFGVPGHILQYLPLFPDSRAVKTRNFNEREGFVSIGNFKHRPNLDAVRWLYHEIWPQIRAQLPAAELRIYGAYIPEEILRLHKPDTGFFVEGWAEDLSAVMLKARILLAPLRFGAGLKGKLFDAFTYGTVPVTTTIGSEGMVVDQPFPTEPMDEARQFSAYAIRLYSDRAKWERARQIGFDLLEHRFDSRQHLPGLSLRLRELGADLNRHRDQNFVGRILRHQSMYASKYMSKWIELKNRS